jgi:hypothetical protein
MEEGANEGPCWGMGGVAPPACGTRGYSGQPGRPLSIHAVAAGAAAEGEERDKERRKAGYSASNT